MVDRERRNLYAEQMRHFAAGLITVDEYESRTEEIAFDTDDSGISAVWGMAWGLYDDFRTHRLRGEWALNSATRRHLARCILFLYSDAEYLWPEDNRPDPKGCIMGGAMVLLCMVSLGFLNPLIALYSRKRWEEQQRWLGQFGDLECWPFLRRTEFEAALLKPRFFAPGGR